jgi:hypothetical protein
LNLKNGPQCPLVILTFDKADTLTDNAPGEEDWNLFSDSELCRVLQQINHLQIFLLFLSTSVQLLATVGCFHKFFPEICEKSAWARDPDHHPLNSILEVSFDDITYMASKDTVTIGRVVEIDWISH